MVALSQVSVQDRVVTVTAVYQTCSGILYGISPTQGSCPLGILTLSSLGSADGDSAILLPLQTGKPYFAK